MNRRVSTEKVDVVSTQPWDTMLCDVNEKISLTRRTLSDLETSRAIIEQKIKDREPFPFNQPRQN
jgi:hypothetical protein